MESTARDVGTEVDSLYMHASKSNRTRAVGRREARALEGAQGRMHTCIRGMQYGDAGLGQETDEGRVGTLCEGGQQVSGNPKSCTDALCVSPFFAVFTALGSLQTVLLKMKAAVALRVESLTTNNGARGIKVDHMRQLNDGKVVECSFQLQGTPC